VDVEVIDEQLAVDAVRPGQLVDEDLSCALDAFGQVRVELYAVARGESRVLDHGGAALRSGTERTDPFAQLDGRCAVAESQADEAIHAGRHCTPLRAVERVHNAAVRALGVDVGGTFTDGVLVSDGAVRTAKVLTRRRQEESVLAVAAELGATGIDRFTHGTTIATNALLERRGARTAFVASEGFEHLLHLRRQTRARLYRPCADRPPPLAPLERCVGVRGRMGPHGELGPLDLATLPDVDAEAIAVCLLFSFLDPRHEQAVSAELRRRYPDAHVVASHEVAPEFREYERASTTVIDAYLGPVLGRYLQALAKTCAGAGLRAPLVMRSSGGLATLEEASAHAAFALLSGPAAGVVGAARIAGLAGYENTIAFDMGGTSTDVCAIVGGAARREHERTIAGFPVRLPTLAVHTVGAGGGSIVWEDEGGALRVGPESAGASPGPACYGRGGTRPTVTDANLLLGRLPTTLAGGIRLDEEAARSALGTLDPAEVVDVVDAEMVRALRVVSVEQGLDPRDFALVAFGGAGPLHACALADELEIGTVLVPAAAGVLSALGLVAADERRDAVRTYVMSLRGAGELPSEGEADLRYAGQSFELTLPLGPDLERRFHAAHAARYGYADRARPLELVAVRTAEVRLAPPVEISGPDVRATGPEVVELEGASVWVDSGWSGETDAHGTLVLRRSS
jgi:N-methylhydantoinase A